MKEYLPANDHGLNTHEAHSFMMFASSEAEWEGDYLLAQDLQKQGAYYKKTLYLANSEYSAQIFSPHFRNKYWQQWRHRNGETAWEAMARRRKEWQPTPQKELRN
jgi:ribulose bisphosphate carboxylase small subunit